MVRYRFLTALLVILPLFAGAALAADCPPEPDIWSIAPPNSLVVAAFDYRPTNPSIQALSKGQTPEAAAMFAQQQLAMRKAYENLATLFGVSLDFAKDIETWSGQQTALVLLPEGEDGVQPVFLVTSKDATAASAALAKFMEPWARAGEVKYLPDKILPAVSFQTKDKAVQVYAAAHGNAVGVSPSRTALNTVLLRCSGFPAGTPADKVFKALSGSMFSLYADPAVAKLLGVGRDTIPVEGLGLGLSVIDDGIKLRALGFLSPEQAAIANMALSTQPQGTLTVNDGIPSTALVAVSLPQTAGFSGVAGMLGMGENPMLDTLFALGDTQVSAAMTAVLPSPGGVATAAAATEQEANDKTNRIVANLRKMKVAVTLTHLSVNQKAYKFKLPQAPEMLLASVGRQVVLATDSQSFKAATATISGAQSGVAKSETYQETMANLEGSNLLTVYGNLAPVQGLGYLVQAMGAEQIQPIYGTFAKALVDLEAFGVGVGFDGEAAQATMFLRAKPGSGAEVLPVMAASAAFGAALLFPAFSTHRQIPQQQDCYDNISCVVKSTLLYASDFNKLPSRTNWRAQITDYVSDSGQFLCADGAAIIAFNKNLGGLDLSKIKNPSEVVMFFEARPGLPYASGSRVDALLPHDGKGWFAYADGHVEQLSAAPSQYHWVPKYAQSKPAPKKAKK